MERVVSWKVIVTKFDINFDIQISNAISQWHVYQILNRYYRREECPNLLNHIHYVQNVCLELLF